MISNQRIAITGFMGSGKTEVARALATELNLRMIDLDEVITARTGRTPAQLILEDGEPAFRKVESETLDQVLKTETKAVLALGGGAWIEEKNRLLIRDADCLSIFLDVPFETCWRRIESSMDERPLGKTREAALERFQRRGPIYKLADIHVAVESEQPPTNIAKRIASQLSDTL
jgi:shikimate kinase